MNKHAASIEPQQTADRFHAIEQTLLTLQNLWRPQPFKQSRPVWCEQHPALRDALLALADSELERLQQSDALLWQRLTPRIPAFAHFETLLALPHYNTEKLRLRKHLDWGIPGRKLDQITTFTAAITTTSSPVAEWCGGKGHLGRLLADHWQSSVATYERDEALCREGEALAERARLTQRFYPVDVLSASMPPLTDQHAVALHACGELHRSLLRKVVDEALPAVDLAPCCYHLSAEDKYTPFTTGSQLGLSRDDLRLAVTET